MWRDMRWPSSLGGKGLLKGCLGLPANARSFAEEWVAVVLGISSDFRWHAVYAVHSKFDKRLLTLCILKFES